MEVNEMCEWFESLIEDLIEEYKNEPILDDIDKVWNHGAIEALEKLLKIIKED